MVQPATEREEGVKLKRDLGLLHATMMGIGGAICSGVFVTLGYAASLAGTALIAAMVLCGIINLFTMLSYAELGAALPRAGGEYTFVKAAFGGFISFATGWFEWISNIFYAAFSAVGFGNLMYYVFPAFDASIIAIVAITIFTIINIKGIMATGRTQTILVVVLLGILIVFVMAGLLNTRAAAPALSAPEGIMGVLRASSYIFVIYLGGEVIAAAQAEVKNPDKNIPRAILLSTLSLLLIYTFIAYVVFGIVTPESLTAQISPLAYVARQFMGNLGMGMITVAGFIAALTSVNTSILAQSRVAYAMAEDGFFPNWCFSLHRNFCTPHLAILLGSIFAATIAATKAVNFVTYSTDFGFMIGFIFVNLALIKLRRDEPGLKRPFKVPLYPATPILGIATSLLLITLFDPYTLAAGGFLFVMGVVFFKLRTR